MNQDVPKFKLSRLLQRIDSPAGAKGVFHVLLVICFVLFIINWLIPHHEAPAGEFSISSLAASIPGFYGLYGFAMCILLVLVAKAARRLLMRAEDYYAPYSVDSEKIRCDNKAEEDGENAL